MKHFSRRTENRDISQHLQKKAEAAVPPPVVTNRGEQPVVAAQTAVANPVVPQQVPAAQQKAFGQMSRDEKATYLAKMMNDASGTIKANGISPHMESMMAGVMMNEGGINTRRITLRDYFSKMLIGKDGDGAGGMAAQLKKAGGLDKLKADPKALASFQKDMGEDQRFMLSRAMSGELDLAGLTSDDKTRQRAARTQMIESGVDLRTQQYDEMSSLMARQKKGETLNEKDAARLKALGDVKGNALGFDGLDQRRYDGKNKASRDASLIDTQGLSSGRFREIYEDSQQRFEVGHYDQWRKGYEEQMAANAKLPPDQQEPMKLGSNIGDHTLTDKDKKGLTQNMDLFADITTSYGAAQTMGLYAHNGDMKGKDAKGQPMQYSIEKLKAAGRRTAPIEEDVQLMLGELNMKKINLGNNNMDAGVMGDLYNGNRKTNSHWGEYVRRLNLNIPAYKDAAKKVDADAAKQRSPNGHFAQ